MKLLREFAFNDLEVLTENASTGKNFYIEGPMLMCNQKNRNGRVYPKSVMEAAVDRYQKEFINERRAIGELTHPNYPMPDIRKAALMIESLSWTGDNVVGKARVLNTPDGQQIKALLEANFKLGVSSRGLGDVKKQQGADFVNSFLLNAIDAVDLPSAQICYVNGLTESVNWVEKNGVWVSEGSDSEPVQFDQFLEAFKEMIEGFKKH